MSMTSDVVDRQVFGSKLRLCFVVILELESR